MNGKEALVELSRYAHSFISIFSYFPDCCVWAETTTMDKSWLKSWKMADHFPR
jgi:hypothetical protein